MDFDLFEKSDRDRSLDKDQLAEAGNGQENTGRRNNDPGPLCVPSADSLWYELIH